MIATVLSQHTSDKNSDRAYHQLKKEYPEWEEVRKSKIQRLEKTIRSGGLARIKSIRIQEILNEIKKRNGKLTLDFLSGHPVSKARKYLESLPGVGPKTASCVLLFSLGKPVLPVDTHVHRVSRRLGLIGNKVSAEKAQVLLESMIPVKERYAFHMALIRHGRTICKSYRPLCRDCFLLTECPSGLRIEGDGD